MNESHSGSTRSQYLHTIGIVGGLGVMGRWFTSFFQECGYQVLIHDLNTQLSLYDCVIKSDVIIVNVPIDVTTKVITDICKIIPPGKLLVDNTSIKAFVISAVKNCAPKSIEFLSMHTIFGPSTASLENQNVIFVRTEISGELSEEFAAIFVKNNARITFCTAEFHDRQMAFHQNLVHFIMFCLGKTLDFNSITLDEFFAFSSPNSLTCLAILGRLLAGDPALYSEIQEYNTAGQCLLHGFAKTFSQLMNSIETNSFEEFRVSIQSIKDTLGDNFIQKMNFIATEIQKSLPEIQKHLVEE